MAFEKNNKWGKLNKYRTHFPQEGFQKRHTLWDHPNVKKHWFKKNHSVNKGKENSMYKQGKFKDTHGYWWILNYEIRKKKKNNYVKRATLIAERRLGRYLKKREIVHHINEKKDDDRPNNLYLFLTQTAHFRFHALKHKPILKSNII